MTGKGMHDTVLEGFQVYELSHLRSGGRWRSKDIISAFLDSGHECIGRDYGNKEEAARAYGAFKNYLRSHKNPVEITRRGSTVFLIRGEE